MNEIQIKSTKKCKCPNKKSMGQACTNCSRYKLVFMLRSDCQQFKVLSSNGKKANPAIWCFQRQNKRPMAVVLAEMLKRIKESLKFLPLYQSSNQVRLYDRQTDEFIVHKP